MAVKDVLAVAAAQRHVDQFRKRQAEGRGKPKPNPKLGIDPKKRTSKHQIKPGAFVRVQRPDLHQAPTLTRLICMGKDGVRVCDDQGRAINIRHDHIVEHVPGVTGKERAAFALSVAGRGVPLSLEDRFFHQSHDGQAPRRATVHQLSLLDHLTQHGIPVDMSRVREGASYDDAQAILRRFVNDPDGRIIEPDDK